MVTIHKILDKETEYDRGRLFCHRGAVSDLSGHGGFGTSYGKQGAAVGVLVLFRVNHHFVENLKIVGILFRGCTKFELQYSSS